MNATKIPCLLLAGLSLVVPSAPAQELKGKEAARCVAVAGVLLKKEAGQPWQAVHSKDVIADGALLVSLPKAEVVSNNGAVRLLCLADVGQRSPFPILETAVTFHAATDADMDITFERGLIVLVNQKKEGEAKVRLRVRDEHWTLHLQEPGTRVGLEIYGRHPPGLPKVIDKKVEDPTTDLLALVLKGQAFLDIGKVGLGLRAPPGPARLHWDSVLRKASVQRLEQLPGNLIKPLDDHEAKLFKDLCACTKKLGEKDIGPALKELLKSDDKLDRLVGVTLAGAVDDLPRLIGALGKSTHAEVRNHAVVALRHWLGRGPGQVKKMYTVLTVDRKLPEAQARSALQLLFGFDDEQRGHPETYDLLIEYLRHSKLPVRELAHWHLIRLAPAGKDIPYDAAAPEEQRRKGYEQWRVLIPEGQLPPRPKLDPPTKN